MDSSRWKNNFRKKLRCLIGFKNIHLDQSKNQKICKLTKEMFYILENKRGFDLINKFANRTFFLIVV